MFGSKNKYEVRELRDQIEEMEYKAKQTKLRHARELEELESYHSGEVSRTRRSLDDRLNELESETMTQENKITELQELVDEHETLTTREFILDEREKLVAAQEQGLANVAKVIREARAEGFALGETKYQEGYADGVSDGVRKGSEFGQSDRELVAKLATTIIEREPVVPAAHPTPIIVTGSANAPSPAQNS